jgi:hypothetical protein
LSVMAMRECLRLRSKCVYEIPVWRIEKIGSCSKGGLQWGFGFLC